MSRLQASLTAIARASALREAATSKIWGSLIAEIHLFPPCLIGALDLIFDVADHRVLVVVELLVGSGFPQEGFVFGLTFGGMFGKETFCFFNGDEFTIAGRVHFAFLRVLP